MIRLCLAKQKLEKDENINTHINNIILFLSHRECGTSWKSFLNFSIKYFHVILVWLFSMLLTRLSHTIMYLYTI